MQPRTLWGRLIAYFLLVAGSALVLFPLVWMVGTSLKPLEQTNSTPPQWMPYQYHAELAGEYQEVIRGEPLRTPMLVIRVDGGPLAGSQQIVPIDQYVPAVRTRRDRGYVTMVMSGQVRRVPATLLHRAEAGWYFVQQRTGDDDSPALWDVVPPEKIQSRAHLFWSNYPEAIERMGRIAVWIPFAGTHQIPIFWIYLRNTLIVSILGVIGTVLSCSLAAYSLSKIPWRGRGALMAFTVATMMVPFPVLMVPLYGLFKWLGWIGTLLPLWVPAFFGGGFSIFLLRQFFLTIPRELSEAARIDGCSELGILCRIILPLSKPGLAVVALFHFFYAWNDFMGPLLFLTRRETFTLSLGLQSYQSQHGGTDWNSLMAASTMICLPIVILFFLTQKTLMRGLARAGIRKS